MCRLRRTAEEASGGGADAETGLDNKFALNTTILDFNALLRQYRTMKETPIEERVVAKRSPIHGWGLFAQLDFGTHSTCSVSSLLWRIPACVIDIKFLIVFFSVLLQI